MSVDDAPSQNPLFLIAFDPNPGTLGGMGDKTNVLLICPNFFNEYGSLRLSLYFREGAFFPHPGQLMINTRGPIHIME